MREDTGELIRLFPITYRRLPPEHQFNRYDRIEVTITKAGDARPESYRLDQATLRVIESGSKLDRASKVRLWLPFIAPSLTDLHEQRKVTKRSLGIVRPDPGSLKFLHRANNTEEREDAQSLQASLFDQPLKPLAPPEFAFVYKFASDGQPHEYSIQDWEVQAAYLNYQREYGSKERALTMLAQEYGENIPRDNPHFIMGTMKRRPHQFLLIGILRSQLDPQELAKQPSLL